MISLFMTLGVSNIDSMAFKKSFPRLDERFTDGDIIALEGKAVRGS